jgi:hypothetical protein
MATWGRGRHILPSVRSVLAQEGVAFELLVVGDACDDDTEAVLAPLLSGRVRWLNLPQRMGSQSGPNMAGIAAARAPLIAYLGHDDLWEPFHLADMVALFDADPGLDFAVGGVIYHLPHGIPGTPVTGLFAPGSDVAGMFFPPSCFAHRREVIGRIGGWRAPDTISDPVDADLLRRAYAAGARFGSNQRISVHKFAAGHRYLSYLRQDSAEQEAMAARMRLPGHAEAVAQMVEQARSLHSFMRTRLPPDTTAPPGERARENRIRKGLDRPAPQALGRGMLIRPEPSFCALDWQDLPEAGIRWAKRSPRPKVLLPCHGTGRALMQMVLAHDQPEDLAEIALRCDGVPVEAMPLSGWTAGDGTARRLFRAVVPLRPDGPAVLDLILTPGQCPAPGQRGLGRRGIGLGDIALVRAAAGTGRGAGLGSLWAERVNNARLHRLRRELSRAGEVSAAIP